MEIPFWEQVHYRGKSLTKDDFYLLFFMMGKQVQTKTRSNTQILVRDVWEVLNWWNSMPLMGLSFERWRDFDLNCDQCTDVIKDGKNRLPKSLLRGATHVTASMTVLLTEDLGAYLQDCGMDPDNAKKFVSTMLGTEYENLQKVRMKIIGSLRPFQAFVFIALNYNIEFILYLYKGKSEEKLYLYTSPRQEYVRLYTQFYSYLQNSQNHDNNFLDFVNGTITPRIIRMIDRQVVVFTPREMEAAANLARIAKEAEAEAQRQAAEAQRQAAEAQRQQEAAQQAAEQRKATEKAKVEHAQRMKNEPNFEQKIKAALEWDEAKAKAEAEREAVQRKSAAFWKSAAEMKSAARKAAESEEMAESEVDMKRKVRRNTTDKKDEVKGEDVAQKIAEMIKELPFTSQISIANFTDLIEYINSILNNKNMETYDNYDDNITNEAINALQYISNWNKPLNVQIMDDILAKYKSIVYPTVGDEFNTDLHEQLLPSIKLFIQYVAEKIKKQ